MRADPPRYGERGLDGGRLDSNPDIGPGAGRSVLVCGIFFLSGVSGLLFEHVWFRKAGLVFGNGVWATSLVLASFMAGLALGSALAARWARRIPKPILAYAAAETLVGLAGAALVLAMPLLPRWLAPLQRPFLEDPWLLNSIRLGTAFALICAVTGAMGTTLPLLTRALSAGDPRFGSVFGRLYGWNTLGAMVGAVAGEGLLYGSLGVQKTGLLAGALSLLSAGLAATLLGGAAPRAAEEPSAPAPPLSVASRRLLAVAGLSGAALLALEVVWSRFLLLFTAGSSLSFAVLLAVILAGIGLGGLLAGTALRRQPGCHEWLPLAALGAGFLVAAGYASFGQVLSAREVTYSASWAHVALLSGYLTFPVALVSGVIFTFTGAGLAQQMGEPGRASGLTVMANTLGAVAGALLAGFLLLPGLGMERSFALLSASYGAVALLDPGVRHMWRRPAMLGAGLLFVTFVVLFPYGLMANSYLRTTLASAVAPGSRVVAFREGLTETAVYVETSLRSEVVEHRLFTNSFTMSATGFAGRRYMKLFVYLPTALHPGLRRALLISYGVGSTAKALVDTAELRGIDVVDISGEILDLSRVVYPDPAQNPLRDPRVRVHVEDGRFFLQTSEERYDLITAEPPPPKIAGVVNLYSLEYFRLCRDRLAEGGIVSYWLPLHSLEPDDARAIIGAFCGAFDDCTLWKGVHLQWLLLGTRHGRGPGSEERFSRQWRDPRVAAELSALGFETPEQLGALFVADAPALRALVGAVPPLVDDFPQRLAPMRPSVFPRWYVPFAEVGASRGRFAASDWISDRWPAGLRERSLAWFELQRHYDRLVPWDSSDGWDDLHAVITGSALETLPLVMLGSDADLQRVTSALEAKGDDSAFVHGQLAFRALARRQFLESAEQARLSLEREHADPRLWPIRVYALALGGRLDDARAALTESRPAPSPETAAFFQRTFGLSVPARTDQQAAENRH